MSMEINNEYKHYKSEYSEKAQVERDKVQEVLQEQRAEDKSKDVSIPKDEYISSEKSGNKPSGLYHLGQDENGNPKIIYDAPKKEVKSKPEAESATGAEECTTNTDNVDREIEKLKEEKKQLEQQIKAAAGDQEKVDELKKKLVQIEGELSRKDNDTYRRQNAVVS